MSFLTIPMLFPTIPSQVIKCGVLLKETFEAQDLSSAYLCLSQPHPLNPKASRCRSRHSMAGEERASLLRCCSRRESLITIPHPPLVCGQVIKCGVLLKETFEAQDLPDVFSDDSFAGDQMRGASERDVRGPGPPQRLLLPEYRGTSLIRNSAPPGPYSRPLPKPIW